MSVLRQIIVATDCDGNEAIYVDGRNVFESGHAYAVDIATAAGDGAITLRHVNVDLPDDADGFPATLDELRPMLSPVEEPIADNLCGHPVDAVNEEMLAVSLPHDVSGQAVVDRARAAIARAEAK